MTIVTIVSTTEAQRKAAKEAAWLRYEDNKHTPDRPGWKGGKCPVTEYFGNLAELGAVNYLGIPDTDLCLYSDNPADYTKPDAGIWEFKAGSSWNASDIRKGVRYILWVEPLKADGTFYCQTDTCGTKVHAKLSGEVLIRGWSHVDDDAWNMHGRFFPKQMNRLDTIPWNTKAVA